MSKYEPLRDYLLKNGSERVAMTFAEIERVLGAKLPSSSATHRAWWSNNPANNVMTKEWLAAGYETEQVDIGGEKLVFRRMRRSGGSHSNGGDTGSSESANGKARLDQLLSRMRGLIRTASDYDPSAPMEDEWPEAYLGTEKKT